MLEDALLDALRASGLGERLGSYQGKPAAFMGEAPEDQDTAWGEKYPRMICSLEGRYARAEVWCQEGQRAPEALCEAIRRQLTGLFAEEEAWFGLVWRGNETLDAPSGLRGAAVRLECVPLGGNPVADAVGRWMKQRFPLIQVAGIDTLSTWARPEAGKPLAAVSVARETDGERQSFAVRWRKAQVSIHIWAAQEQELRETCQKVALALDAEGQAVLPDGGPLLWGKIELCDWQEPLPDGQIGFEAGYGVLRGREPCQMIDRVEWLSGKRKWTGLLDF